jgi:hypothetical protein
MMKKAQVYHGSAKTYIVDHIIPELPPVKHSVAYFEALLTYLKDPKALRIIRKLSGFDNRGVAYLLNERLFTVGDNEPALWVYMESIFSAHIDFEKVIGQQELPIAFSTTAKEIAQDRIYTKVGKRKREKDFSLLGWKHCHILPCSPRGDSKFNEVSIDQRMLRFLSPMNHFPFPSPKKFSMPTDYGEDASFIQLVIQVLLDKVYQTSESRQVFKDYLQLCGMSELEFEAVQAARDFDITISPITEKQEPNS